MKPIADWIRDQTPGWTDDARYTLVSRIHSWGPPLCLILFVFTDNMALRFFTLVLVLATLLSELMLRECLVTMVEREFSDSTWDDLFQWGIRQTGWELSRSEKMALNIGLNSGFLILVVLMLLRESVLWMVGITGLAVSAIPALGLLSRVRLPLESVAQLGLQIPSLPASP